MKKIILTMFVTLFFSFRIATQNIVKGVIIDSNTEKPLQGVLIQIKEHHSRQTTSKDGIFILENLPNGKHLLVVKYKGYETQNYPIKLSGKTIHLGAIMLYQDVLEEQDLSTITITDDELNDNTISADNISGLLQSSRDTYLRAAAFEWSSSFYRIRGLDSENAKVLMNGIEMNKLYNGRPQWSNWGGLNDVLREQEFSNFLKPSSYTFGGVLGTTNINVSASKARPGGRVTYSTSNRSYAHRIMASYASGLNKNGWAYTVSAGRRAGNEGFVEGTSYNANSFFISVEKKINDKHSINLTSIYASNKRGKSAPETQDVFNLKGIKYNSYWGYQNGKARNSRIKRVEEPIVMLNYYWNISNNTTLNTNIGYQFGEVGNSRLDFNGGNDPSPTYYRKLPNWFLSDLNGPDFENAFKASEILKKEGQINWDDLYFGNENSGDNARFVLYEDRNDDTQLSVNTIVNSELTKNITLSASLEYKKFNSKNFAAVLDLLGGTGYLDVNKFGATFEAQQNDILNPNRIVKVGDTFKYNYNLASKIYTGFAQLQFNYNKTDFYIAGNAKKTTHQREGLYQNGEFITNSLGKSNLLNFFNFGAKAGLTYKISGRHLLDFNIGYISKAPFLRNSFANSRANNFTVADVAKLNSEIITSFDASYLLRSPILQAKLTGYYAGIKDATEISFFFNGDTTSFIQEIITEIDKTHFGIELGIEAQVTSTIKIKGAANYGQYTYSNNPNVTLTSSELEPQDYGKATLKNYKIASGPQNAFSLGFEYRDPDYWFVGITGNYLDKAYIDISPIKRTTSYIQDIDGQVFADFDSEIARDLLKQEKFDDYFTINAIGGKSWKIGNQKYIGFFASIANILGEEYKTGGYEQGRTSNYRLDRDDKINGTPNFGNKYWYGRGTTYFLNINYRF